MTGRRGLISAALVTAGLAAGCGTDQAAPDLFLVTRAGPTGTLTMLVNDGGTIRCDGGPAKPLGDPLLLAARDVADSLSQDIPNQPRYTQAGGVYRFAFRLSQGTLRFADVAAAHHPDLGHAEQFVLSAAHGPCAGSPGS